MCNANVQDPSLRQKKLDGDKQSSALRWSSAVRGSRINRHRERFPPPLREADLGCCEMRYLKARSMAPGA